MKKFFLVFLILTINFLAFAQIQDMAEFKSKKLEFYSQSNTDTIIEEITKEIRLLNQYKTSYSEELFLTLENNLISEKVNFSLSDKNLKEEIYTLLTNQNIKNIQFIGEKKYKEFFSDYLVSLGDIKAKLLGFLSNSQMISESMTVKELYLTALKKNNESSSASLSYAMWLYFAPVIAGGGNRAAYKKIIEAEENAQNDSDLFFALIYKSQILFALKRFDESQISLQQAHQLVPKEQFTRIIGSLNAQGRIFFDKE